MILFDGKAESAHRKSDIATKVAAFQLAQPPILFSLVFQEDEPSIIYTRLKKKDAESVGIAYEDTYLPIATPVADIQKRIQAANGRTDVFGIIIQKPSQSLMPSQEWWDSLVLQIDPKKDVDGLISQQSGVLPATARGIMEIVSIAEREFHLDLGQKNAVVIGKSEIVGAPVANELEKMGMHVERMGRQELALHREKTQQADVLVCATGQELLLSVEDIKQGAIVIDAGSPKPEVDPTNLESTAAFLSPVPGGVGPMTRICLLENFVDLVQSRLASIS